MVAWVQGRGRRSGTSLLTNRRLTNRLFPSERPAPPNCPSWLVSAPPPDTPRFAEELAPRACARRYPSPSYTNGRCDLRHHAADELVGGPNGTRHRLDGYDFHCQVADQFQWRASTP